MVICRRATSFPCLIFKKVKGEPVQKSKTYAIIMPMYGKIGQMEEKTMYDFEEIKKADAEIAEAIEEEMKRQNSHIELIASENWVSKAVMAAMGSPLTVSYTHLDVYKRQVWNCTDHNPYRRKIYTFRAVFCRSVTFGIPGQYYRGTA